MMSTKERMKNNLSKLDLYSNECPILNGEIEAYAAAVDFVKEQCDNIRKELFTVTAENDGLTRFEHILGLEEKELSTEERRKRILPLCALIPGQPNTDKFVAELMAMLPPKYSIKFYPSKYTVRLTGPADFSMDKITAAADYVVKYGPAHIRFMINKPMYTWEQIEALDMTFFDIREKGIPWGFFDETY